MRGKLQGPVRIISVKRKAKDDIRNQVGLELVQVDVEGTVEAKRRSDGGNNLSNQPVQVCEAWGGDAKVLLANIVDGLIVNLEKTSIQSTRADIFIR